jgi:hypothetical protein
MKLSARVFVLDGLTVLVFVLIGRANHHHGENATGVLSTLWPFAVGVVVGWMLLARQKQDGLSPRNGVVVTLSTVIVGMVLRAVFGQGTAFAFIVVALVFLGAVMVGWRLLLPRFERRKRAS